MGDEQSRVSRETEEAERAEAAAPHQPDRLPTPEEEAAADDAAQNGVPSEVASHERDMAERGARVKGEGQIT